MVGKINDGILVEKFFLVTEELTVEEQSARSSGKGYVNQIFSLKQMFEKTKEKINFLSSIDFHMRITELILEF